MMIEMETQQKKSNEADERAWLKAMGFSDEAAKACLEDLDDLEEF
jgi:hypothetical protein